MSYQGHLADGSSIQKHSAGGLFPFIIFAKQSGEKLLWGVLSPTGDERLFCLHDNAVAFAVALKAHKEARTPEDQSDAACRLLAARLADPLARLSVN